MMKTRKTEYGYRYIAAGVKVSNDTFVTGQNNHDLICGPSGKGKTGGYVNPNLLDPSESMLVVDTKGLLYKQHMENLQSKGFKVAVLDLVNPKNSTVGYNPLAYIRRDRRGNYSQKDMKSVMNAMVAESYKSDPYWTASARKYMSMIVSYVLEFLPKKDHNMTSVVAIHQELCAGNMFSLLQVTADENPESMFTGNFKQVVGLKESEKTWACVLDFASNALDVYDVKEMKVLWTKKTVDFGVLGREKSILFVNISDMDRTYDSVLNLLYIQALQVLVAEADKNPNGRLIQPMRFIMDDFTSGAPIKDFDKIISVIRSRDISVSLIIQSLSQLETLYGVGESKTILNNCDHILYLGGQDKETMAYIADRINKPKHIIETLPNDKAYLLSSGQPYKLVDKIPPYSKVDDFAM